VASREINQIILASDDPFVRSANKCELAQIRPVGRMNSSVLEKLQKTLTKSIQKYIQVPASADGDKDREKRVLFTGYNQWLTRAIANQINVPCLWKWSDCGIGFFDGAAILASKLA
jgi:hypothetical protein